MSQILEAPHRGLEQGRGNGVWVVAVGDGGGPGDENRVSGREGALSKVAYGIYGELSAVWLGHWKR